MAAKADDFDALCSAEEGLSTAVKGLSTAVEGLSTAVEGLSCRVGQRSAVPETWRGVVHRQGEKDVLTPSSAH